jgi:protein O-mannosyl-transferase
MGRKSKSRKRRVAEPDLADRKNTATFQDRSISTLAFGASSRFSILAVCVFLLLAVLAVFGQTHTHEFIDFDDNVYIYENGHVRGGLTRAGLGWALTSTHAGFWHPLTTISHMLDIEMFGLNSGRHHAISVFIHAATAMMLFLAILRLTREFWPSAVAAAVFAIHPLRVESVAWAAERKDVLSGFFFALTLLLYAGYARQPSILRYLAVALSLSLGLMCKPMLVTTPFVLLLLDYWPLDRVAGSGWWAAGKTSLHRPRATRHAPSALGWLMLEKAPLLVLALLMSAVTVWAQEVAIQSTAMYSLQARFANAAVSYVAYLRQMFWPSGLAVFYPHPKDSLPAWQALGAFGLLSAISVSLFLLRQRRPYLLVGWLWYLGMLVPVIGFVQSGEQARADRFTYLPQIGLAIALVWWAADASRGWRHQRLALAPLVVGVVAVLAFIAERQTRHWHDSVTLFNHTLDCTSPNSIARNNLAFALAELGQDDDAIVHYQRALEIQPGYASAHVNLGKILARRGQVDEAIVHFRNAVEIRPDYALAYYNLGTALDNLGQVDEVIIHYRKTLELEPDFFEARNNLGIALTRRGEVDEAVFHFRKVLEFKPDFAKARYNLAVVLAGRGQADEAIVHFQKALEVQPDDFDTHHNLALALLGVKRVDEAIVHLQKALEIQPDSAKAHFNFGFVLTGRGRSDEADKAIEHYRKALALAIAQHNQELADAARAQLRQAGKGDEG